MAKSSYILAIDQGTTSTKALVLDTACRVVGSSAPDRFGVAAIYPRPGWVEFDPVRMLETVCASAHAAVSNAGLTLADIAGIGLANQGETVVAFNAQDEQADDQTTDFEPDDAAHRYYADRFETWKRVCSAVIAMGDDGLFASQPCGEIT